MEKLIYSKDEVLEIIKKVQKDVKESAYTYEKGCSDGYECWDITEIDFREPNPNSYL